MKRNIKKEETEEDLTLTTMRALVAAREAFNAYLGEDGNDPAYWDIRFTAWLVSSDFTTRLERVEIEQEVKEKHNA
jgi:hypothetical protein